MEPHVCMTAATYSCVGLNNKYRLSSPPHSSAPLSSVLCSFLHGEFQKPCVSRCSPPSRDAESVAFPLVGHATMADELELSDDEEDPLFGGVPRPSVLSQQQHGLLNGGPRLGSQPRSTLGGLPQQEHAPPHHHEPAPLSQPAPPSPMYCPSQAQSQPQSQPQGHHAQQAFGVSQVQASGASQARWIPGPAGALLGGTMGSHHPGANGGDTAATQRPREKFRRTAAWEALEEQSRRHDGSSASTYSTLGRVLEQCAAVPPRGPTARPVRVPLLNVLLTAVSQADMGESSAADLGVTVGDESGEMQGTLHRGVLNEHPGKVGVGAALALTQVTPCLLAPHRCTASSAPPLHRR